MTTQEAYEKMRAWLSRPDATRAHDGRYCSYRTQQGNKCAVGALLSDEAIDQLQLHDAGSVWSIIDDRGRFPLAISELEDVSVEFLADAQVVHDREANWESGTFAVTTLDEVAETHGLLVPSEIVLVS